MTPGSPHPSYLELDRYALGVPTREATATHVGSCAACRAHVASVRSTPASRGPDALEERLVARQRSRRRQWLRAASVGLSLAAALCLTWLSTRDREPAFDTVKGAPSVALHVSRAGNVRLWNGEPLRAGDRIRLEVAPHGFRYVSVFSEQAQGRLVRLYAGAVPGQGTHLLPKAWQLDDAREAEHLIVFFASAEISAAAARALLLAYDPKDVWPVHLSLPRSAR